jgi:hypothetical protein
MFTASDGSVGGLGDEATGATRDRAAGSVAGTARPDHRARPSAGGADGEDGLGILEGGFGAVNEGRTGRPLLVTRLMAGLPILKHMHDLSRRGAVRPLGREPLMYFCGEGVFWHEPRFDRSSLTHWRHRMGEERLGAAVQESLSVATRGRNRQAVGFLADHRRYDRAAPRTSCPRPTPD